MYEYRYRDYDREQEYESMRLLSKRDKTARKQHICDRHGCRFKAIISPGQRYTTYALINLDGDFEIQKEHYIPCTENPLS